MSDEQGQQVTGQDQDQPDESEPNDARQGELEAAYKMNIEAGNLPYDRVWIRTLGELKWIMQARQWSGSGERLSGGVERPDFRGADFSHTDLRGASLFFGHFTGAHFIEADLSGAILTGANMTGALLWGTTLRGATLFRANLTDASLTAAVLTLADLGLADLHNALGDHLDLREAKLIGTKLDGTDLNEADLRGTDLRRCRMDSATVLREVKLSPSTLVADVVWNGVPLTQVDWGQAKKLGDEQLSKDRQQRPDHIEAIAAAARAYRGLSIALRSQGLLREASGYRLREQRLERVRYRAERKFGAWTVSWFLDAVSGYGERPGLIALTYIIVVAGFTGAYWLVTHFLETKLSALTWQEALVLSLTSFHGRGFFPGFLSLGDTVAQLGAAEAVIGLLIEIILIATFTRRFLGN